MWLLNLSNYFNMKQYIPNSLTIDSPEMEKHIEEKLNIKMTFER